MLYPRWLQTLLLTLTAFALMGASVACGSDEEVTPAAYTSPVDGRQYCAWVNNPHECEGSGLTPAPFPIPTSQPVREPGMSDADFLLLGGLFGYGLGHHSYYYSDGYYNRHIGPAWSHYPGTYYGYGHQPVTQINNVKVYRTTINNVNTRYAAQERTAERSPSTGGYKSTTGKTYTGNTVPAKVFRNTNAPVKAGGNAGRGKSPTGHSSTGKGGYSHSSGGHR